MDRDQHDRAIKRAFEFQQRALATRRISRRLIVASILASLVGIAAVIVYDQCLWG